MFKCLAIAPYKGLKDLILDVANDFSFEIDVEVGDLNQGLSIAKCAEDKGYDVIISRGGTAELIRAHCQIPIVEIKVTGYDILRTLTLLNGYSKKIGIIGFPNVVYGVDTVAELLGMEVMQFKISHQEEAETAVRRALESGVTLIIGDVITVSIAERVGLQAILISSGKEAIYESIHDAEKMYYWHKQKLKQIERYTSLLKLIDTGIVVVDRDGKICYFNEKAEELFGTSLSAVIGTNWMNRILKTEMDVMWESKHKDIGKVIEWNGRHLLVAELINTFNDERVFTICDSGSIQSAERKLRKAIYQPENNAKVYFSHLLGTSKLSRQLIEKARKWSKLKEPLLFCGESGTGKKSLAQAIHNASEYQTGQFIVFDAELENKTDDGMKLFEMGGNSGNLIELAHEGTLYINEIGKLSISDQKNLLQVLESQMLVKKNGSETIPIQFRLIASQSNDLLTLVTEGKFISEMYYHLNTYTLALPALRDRMEDINDLIRLIIAEANETLGKQVVGVKPDVMNMLTGYDWPGNISQLKHVLISMIQKTDSSFISREHAQPIMDQLYRTVSKSQSIHRLIGKNRTLEEIEKDIIQVVLEEEDFNQSKVAERLGINRSTLWRKLKNV